MKSTERAYPLRVDRATLTGRRSVPVFPPISGQFMSRSACLKGANNGSAIPARAKEKAARERLLNSNLILAG